MKISALISRLFLLLAIINTLGGCAAAVVAGGATGAAVVFDRRTSGSIIEDQAIETKAWQAFNSDKDINEKAHLNVVSYNTIVLVTGEAPDEEIRQRIINIVQNLDKVSHVYNEITIAAPSSLVSRSSDSLITSKVKTKLLALENFNGTSVKVVTEKGVVYLMGLLSHEEADRATDAVRTIGGVQKVVKLFQYTE
ncbi:MAG: BON domain-containing protein [Gammaproteobacteria bacterium]